MKKKRGDVSVYMQFKKEDGIYFSIENIFPDIVVNPDAKKGEGKLAELIVLSNEEES
jgi:hypothetical protein